MTDKEVKKKLKEAGLTWKAFLKYMTGQTVGMNDDGSTNWYECDVNRFLHYKGDTTKIPWWLWD